jgi:hypothetical protein
MRSTLCMGFSKSNCISHAQATTQDKQGASRHRLKASEEVHNEKRFSSQLIRYKTIWQLRSLKSITSQKTKVHLALSCSYRSFQSSRPVACLSEPNTGHKSSSPSPRRLFSKGLSPGLSRLHCRYFCSVLFAAADIFCLLTHSLNHLSG